MLLDRSGSMAGWKMVAARRALARMIESLTERDRFTVFAFDDALETPPVCGDGLVPATDHNRFRAAEWLDAIDARGGTEMAGPLDSAVAQLSDERDRVLVLVTDGQVGNEDQILQLLGKRLRGIRIFTLGVDRAVNEAFLKRLAALGGGCCDVVESEDRLDGVMDKLQRRIGAPVLTGLSLEAEGIELEADSLVPGRVPDLFDGVPLLVSGRYRGVEGTVRLRATDEAGREVVHTLAGRVSRQPALARIWARGRLRELEDRWVIGVESPAALEQQIVALSLKYGVLCRFTAFVAVDRSAVVNEGGQQQRLIQPVEPVEGWAALEVEALANTGVCGAASVSCCALEEDSETAYRADFQAPEEQSVADAPPSVGGLRKDGEVRARRAMRGYAAPKSPGVIGRTLERLFGGHATKSTMPAEPTADLAAYRQRAKGLLAALQADADANHALGVLRVNLQALVDDLRSIGAPAVVVEPLEKLLRQLQSAGADAQLRADAERVLGAFAGVP